MHLNCRSSIEPVINEDIESKMIRRVRDPITGKDNVETFRKKVINSK